MTPFSTVLEFYMKEKDIRTYSIAQFCGIDRSNMYKLINGKRNPASEEIVGRISEYMRLKPMEKKRLMEAYQITVMGYDAYHRRKSVQDFLNSFPVTVPEPGTEPFWGEDIIVNEQDLSSVRGTVMKDRRLKHLISSVLHIEAKKQTGKIELLMQPEDNNIMDMLLYAGVKRTNLEIEHIFCLNNTNDIVSEKRDYNLYCLHNILPMFIQGACTYQPYCYYDNIVSHNSRFNFLSSMILTSEYAIVFSMEGKYGMLLSEEDTIQHLHILFQSLKEDTSMIACKLNSIEKQLNKFGNIDFLHKGISFQPESCLIPMIPTEFLGKYLYPELLLQGEIQERAAGYILQTARISELSETTYIFTETGIRKFAVSGRISDLPASVYRPLDYGDRMLLLRRLTERCKTGRYRMLRADSPVADVDICLYSSMQEGYLLLPAARGERIFLELHEPGLLYAFRDYFEALDEKYFYSIEETICILKKLFTERGGGKGR